MKNLKTITVFFVLFTIPTALSQVKVQAKKAEPLFNSKTNCLLRYYYFPNVQAYFDTQKMIYHYKENGEWKTAEELPNGYMGYSMYNKVSVFINDYDDDNICQFIDIHKKKYPYITNERIRKLTVSNE